MPASWIWPGTTLRRLRNYGRFAFNPLIVDNIMYVGGKDVTAVVALDAATGKEIWSRTMDGRVMDRGFHYWESKDRSDRRLIFLAGGYVCELDARTGDPIKSFGKDGRIEFRGEVSASGPSGTPGRVFEDLIILGSVTGEGYGSPPGHIRAYNVLTGKVAWVFHNPPLPGEYGYDTWPPDTYKLEGGTNVWGGFSVDEKRGIVYLPTSSPTHDFYGYDRHGAGLFGDCLLALDARTGKRIWHFQAVHHNIWDYDLCTSPLLMTVRFKGKPVDIVAFGTKFGFLYVFDRVTGKPLWPIEERPVPKSDVPGEMAYPTQPFPTWPPPFARQKMTVNDINPLLEPAEAARIKEIFLKARNEGVFTPTAFKGDTIEIPGELGGTNWGGMAGDPTTGWAYVRTTDIPTLHTMREVSQQGQGGKRGDPRAAGPRDLRQAVRVCHPDQTGVNFAKLGDKGVEDAVRAGQGSMQAYSENALPARDLDAVMAYIANPAAGAAPAQAQEQTTPPAHVRYSSQFANVFRAKNGLPAISPPWSEIVAYDLNTGNIKWRIPMGTVTTLAAKGITNTGSYRPERNGLVVTAGGLLIAGTASDLTVHVWDKDTGKLLWEKKLDANPEGIPAVYEVGGRQYIAWFACPGRGGAYGEAWTRGKPEARGYYVFALPKK